MSEMCPGRETLSELRPAFHRHLDEALFIIRFAEVSLMRSILKLFDPMEERMLQEDLRRKREVLPGETDDGDEPLAIKFDPAAEGAAKVECYRCHVCGYESDRAEFCPRCLADTMRR